MVKGILIGLSVIAIAVLGLLIEAKLAANRPREAFQNPSPEPMSFGTGTPFRYVVMGDSTGAGQGAPYDAGIAVRTAKHLAESRQVSLVNVSVSGARTADALRNQLPKVTALEPDAVLVSLGANDVTHLTGQKSVRQDLEGVVSGLIAANCNVKIVLTGSPDIGGARAFAQPLRWVAGWRTKSLNQVFEKTAAERRLTFARIADRTGPLFRRDRGLLAADEFHPNERGYGTWLPVLEEALDEALMHQPSHCTPEPDRLNG